jgi:hypothetical protein
VLLHTIAKLAFNAGMAKLLHKTLAEAQGKCRSTRAGKKRTKARVQMHILGRLFGCFGKQATRDRRDLRTP